MSQNLREMLKVVALVADTQVNTDTTTTGSGVAAGLSVHRAMAVVTVRLVGAGADDTYVFTIEGSNTAIDSGFALAHALGEPLTMPLTQPNALTSSPFKIGLLPKKWYRYKLVTANGADLTFAISLLLQPSKLPAAAQLAT